MRLRLLVCTKGGISIWNSAQVLTKARSAPPSRSMGMSFSDRERDVETSSCVPAWQCEEALKDVKAHKCGLGFHKANGEALNLKPHATDATYTKALPQLA